MYNPPREHKRVGKQVNLHDDPFIHQGTKFSDHIPPSMIPFTSVWRLHPRFWVSHIWSFVTNHGVCPSRSSLACSSAPIPTPSLLSLLSFLCTCTSKAFKTQKLSCISHKEPCKKWVVICKTNNQAHSRLHSHWRQYLTPSPQTHVPIPWYSPPVTPLWVILKNTEPY